MLKSRRNLCRIRTTPEISFLTTPFLILYVKKIVKDLGEGAKTDSAAERACHPDEFATSKNIKVDIEYYVLNQIFNPISRILEHFKEINLQRIGEGLGIEKNKIPKR